METTDRSLAGESDGGVHEPELPEISAYATSEKRTVFTESDNGDGWIATDLTIEPRR